MPLTVRALLPRPRAALGALAVALLVAGCGAAGDDSTVTPPPAATSQPGAATPPPEVSAATGQPTAGPAATVVRARYQAGEVQGGVQDVEAAVGTPVRLEVTSDVAEEVHAHGVDVSAAVAPGATAVVELTYPAAGSYEVELEDSGTQLFRVQVR